MKEKNVEFNVEEVFYNKHMELSRDISSLIVGSIEDELNVLDGFSASGIRGIRYYLENNNVKEVTFVDISEEAIKRAEENAKKNNIKYALYNGDILTYLLKEKKHNFIELDPFGSPSFYVRYAIHALKDYKKAYLSLTATDTAVLCGRHKEACLKYYGGKPLRNYFCHETGLRILLYHVQREAFHHHFLIRPLVSFYYRHQMKVIVELIKGAKLSNKGLENIGFVCWNRETFKTSYTNIFSHCKYDKYSGPLWIGDLHNDDVVRKALNRARNNGWKKAEKMLSLFLEENHMPPYFFSIHVLGKLLKINQLPRVRDVIKKAEELGVKVTRTHFQGDAVKTHKLDDLIFVLNSLHAGGGIFTSGFKSR